MQVGVDEVAEGFSERHRLVSQKIRYRCTVQFKKAVCLHSSVFLQRLSEIAETNLKK